MNSTLEYTPDSKKRNKKKKNQLLLTDTPLLRSQEEKGKIPKKKNKQELNNNSVLNKADEFANSPANKDSKKRKQKMPEEKPKEGKKRKSPKKRDLNESEEDDDFELNNVISIVDSSAKNIKSDLESKKKKRKVSEESVTEEKQKLKSVEKKGKKDSKNLKEIDNEDDFELTSVSLKSPPANISLLSEGSKKKKKRKSSEEEEYDQTMGEENVTSLSLLDSPLKKLKAEEVPTMNTEENKLILKLALEQVSPTIFHSYVSEMGKLDYEKIAEHFEDKSSEDCETLLKELISKTVKMKGLHQILSETVERLPLVNKTRKVGAFTTFMAQNKEKVLEAQKEGLGKDRFSAASVLWKTLTDEEKKSYGSSGGGSTSKKSDMSGKTPFDLFMLHRQKKDEVISVKEARTLWSDLQIQKKAKYIIKSTKIMMQENEKKESDEDDESGSPKLRGPTKEEIKQYMAYVGLPKAPSTFLNIYYVQESFDPTDERCKNVLTSSKKLFNELSCEKQMYWTSKHKKALESYEKFLKRWKEKQDDVTMYIYQKFILNISGKKIKPKVRKAHEKVFHEIEMPLLNVKFDNEPVAPPLTPVVLYCKELEKKTGEKLKPIQYRQQFTALDKEAKDTFKSKSLAIRAAYAEVLRGYVRSMKEDQRKLFLGTKRAKYYKSLKEDVFESEFPNSEYLVYVKPSNASEAESKKRLRKSKGEQEESLEEETEEEEEVEEEEEEVKAASPPKKFKKEVENLSSKKQKSLLKKQTSSVAKSAPKSVDSNSDSESSSENAAIQTWMNSTQVSKREDYSEGEESDTSE